MTFSLIAVRRPGVRCTGGRYSCQGPGGADGAICDSAPASLRVVDALPGNGGVSGGRRVAAGAERSSAGPGPAGTPRRAGGWGRGPPGDKDIRW